MDDDLMVVERIDEHRSICVSTLAKETIIDAEAGHLGDGGFFIYEVDDRPHFGSMNILAKAVSLEAVFRIVEIWRSRNVVAA